MQRIARGAWTKPELLSVPFTIREGIWGGWTCDKCGRKSIGFPLSFCKAYFMDRRFFLDLGVAFSIKNCSSFFPSLIATFNHLGVTARHALTRKLALAGRLLGFISGAANIDLFSIGGTLIGRRSRTSVLGIAVLVKTREDHELQSE
jgi:hypothetical protein